MRIFVGLEIDDAIRERIQRFLEGIRGFAPEARWVRSESLHVTLKFIGEASEEVVKQTKAVLSTVQGSDIEMAFRGYGFFPGAKTARVFWLGIETGPQLGALAAAVDNATSTLGIPKEEHPFSPHLTLARGGGRSGSPRRQKDDGANLIFAIG
jgi:2'-5' RNA ligase